MGLGGVDESDESWCQESQVDLMPKFFEVGFVKWICQNRGQNEGGFLSMICEFPE